MSYPLPVRVLSFEDQYQALDPEYKLPAVDTFARQLRKDFGAEMKHLHSSERIGTEIVDNGLQKDSTDINEGEGELVDHYEEYLSVAINLTKNNTRFVEEIRRYGKPWFGIQKEFASVLPDYIDEKERIQIAYNSMRRLLNEIFGEGKWDTETRPSKTTPGKMTKWVVIKD